MSCGLKKNNKFVEAQCGYRQNRSTFDNIFSLMGIIQKYISKKKGRLYCLFIDFSAAFDSVRHEMLWYALMKQGVHGNILNVLKSMYSKLQTSIIVPNGITEYFKCDIGTRQGCMISPTLFVLFLNHLYEMFQKDCHGIFISEFVPNLTSLFYADDIANVSDSVGRLQQQINILAKYCHKYGMKVNTNKTKVIVFRRGGIVRSDEKFYFGCDQIKTVTYYKYLGVNFSPFLSWSQTHKTLVSQAEKTVALLKRKFKASGMKNVEHMFILFDRMVTPMLSYGAEIWGTCKVEYIEKVQTKFCKYILGVNSKTSNSAVLGECGRQPLVCAYMVKCVNYWIKLTNMSLERYPKNIYNMLCRLDENGRKTWSSDVKSVLYTYGFGHVWES